MSSLCIEPFCSPTTWKMSDIFHDLAWKISNFFRNYKLQRPSARWHVVRDNVFRCSRSLAATCSHSTGRKWPQVAAGASDRPNLPSDRKWPQRASGRKWPQVAAEGKWPQVTASGRKWPQVAASVKWPQVAASGRFRQVAASGRKWPPFPISNSTPNATPLIFVSLRFFEYFSMVRFVMPFFNLFQANKIKVVLTQGIKLNIYSIQKLLLRQHPEKPLSWINMRVILQHQTQTHWVAECCKVLLIRRKLH